MPRETDTLSTKRDIYYAGIQQIPRVDLVLCAHITSNSILFSQCLEENFPPNVFPMSIYKIAIQIHVGNFSNKIFRSGSHKLFSKQILTSLNPVDYRAGLPPYCQRTDPMHYVD